MEPVRVGAQRTVGSHTALQTYTLVLQASARALLEAAPARHFLWPLHAVGAASLLYRRFSCLAQRGYAAEPVRVEARSAYCRFAYRRLYMVCMHLHRHSALNLFGGDHAHTSEGYGRPWAIAQLWVISLLADMRASQTSGAGGGAKAAPTRLFLWSCYTLVPQAVGGVA